MKIKASKKNIHRFKNYLDKNLFEYFYSFFLDNHYFNDPTIKSRALYSESEILRDYGENSECFGKTIAYKNKLLRTLTELYGNEIVDFSGVNMRKWYSGEFQNPHSDCEAKIYLENEKVMCEPYNNFSSLFIEYAAILYLNDDYCGGEIYFPQHDISIKPEPNELITFPGTQYYVHGVNPISYGNRFVIQNFLSTIKLRYIWEKFVIPNEKILYIDETIDYYQNNKVEYSRSNIPINFIYNKKD